MRATRIVTIVALVLGTALLSAQARRTLDIYVVDVEGGNATLFVTPAGESVLIDAGNGGPAAARDAGRIFDAVKDAGLTQIDHYTRRIGRRALRASPTSPSDPIKAIDRADRPAAAGGEESSRRLSNAVAQAGGR